MSDKRPPYHRRKTKPLPREDLAPIEPAPETRPALEEAEAIARSAEADAVTMARCPLCLGCGMVTPEIAVTFEGLVAEAKERA